MALTSYQSYNAFEPSRYFDTLLSTLSPIIQWKISSYGKQQQGRSQRTTKTLAWRQVDAELTHTRNPSYAYWWNHTGNILATLLSEAEYSHRAQHAHLDFFAKQVVPQLGANRNNRPGHSQWQSYMTDNGTPIELSWDWGSGSKSPQIRYSIEPVGLSAGTSHDPHNAAAGDEYHQRLSEILPEADVEWYRHFHRRFRSASLDSGSENTSTATTADLIPSLSPAHFSTPSLFYAFDLSDSASSPATGGKAYFFPTPSSPLSPLEQLCSAISSAPLGADSALQQALALFRAWILEPRAQPIEISMLAIDLVAPHDSRIKIYVRDRRTTWASVRAAMTLGGRVVEAPGCGNVVEGVDKLRGLWSAVLGLGHDGTAADHDDVPLDFNPHPTAGILYNIELRPRSAVPLAKVYIPVRHYARSDACVMEGLGAWLASEGRAQHWPAFKGVMEGAFGKPQLGRAAGVQTYLAASLTREGGLRVVSYFCP